MNSANNWICYSVCVITALLFTGHQDYILPFVEVRKERVGWVIVSNKIPSWQRGMPPEEAIVAVSGTYFDPRSRTMATLVIQNGELVSQAPYWVSKRTPALLWDGKRWIASDVLLARHDGNVYVYRSGNSNSITRIKVKWGIGGGPWLVRDGKIVKHHPGWSKYILRSRRFVAMGITQGGKVVVIVNTSLPLFNIAFFMTSVGVINAIRLDGGASTFLWHRKRVIIGGRYPHNILWW